MARSDNTINPTCRTKNCGNPALSSYDNGLCADCAGQYEADRARIGRRMGVPCATTAYMTPTCPIPALTAFTRHIDVTSAPSDEGTVFVILLNPLPAVAVPQNADPAPLPFHLTHRALHLAIGLVALLIVLLFAAMPGGEDYAAAVQLGGTFCLACALMLFGSEWVSGRREWFHGETVGEEGEDEV